jgi:hypothetical protein
MADKKRAKKKAMADRRKPDQERATRERKERRFLPEETRTTWVWLVTAWVGAAAIGAGVWGRWISDPPHDFAVYLLLAGAVATVAAIRYVGGTYPVRVGDAGVALERGSELTRLLWCDIERVRADAEQLVLEGKERSLTIPLDIHRRAVANILSEGTRRLPDIMDVKESILIGLPKPDPKAGQSLPVTDVQAAGRHCAASGKAIAFEKDARVCQNCGQIYHHQHVPETCTTCEHKLGSRALRATA